MSLTTWAIHTGVYWKPVWHILEEQFTLILANAMHIRNIPGRQSDKNNRRGSPTCSRWD
jgi:hypothetical protein